jgi:4-aminobutyrate aminotransferase / (S)-3-amino-2-methylpropionate transaminase / 5-aminovalerate transaminase
MPLSELPPPVGSDGQDPPLVRMPPPGPLSRSWAMRLERVESPAFAARRALREGVSDIEQAPIVYASGNGVNVFDVDGNRYVDLSAGFGALLLGHGAARTARALEMQSHRLWQALGDVYPSDGKIALLERIAGLYPEKGARVLLGQSGADAITAALKTAVLATGKPGVVGFTGAYHGLSYAPLSISSFRPSFREPFAAQLNPHARIVPFASRAEEMDAALSALDGALSKGDVGAVVVEPILGRGGCIPAAPGFLREVAERAKKAGAILVVDEIWTGLGRSGALLASTEDGVVADLVCLGKGLGGGLPLSACVGSDAVMSAWAKAEEEVVHTATFHGSPLACSTAIAVLDAIRSQHLVERSASVGEGWLDSLRSSLSASPMVRAVRGRGLMIGIELTSAAVALGVARELLGSGYIVLTGGPTGETLTLTPPLTIEERLLDGFVAVVGGILEARAID